MHNSFTLWFTGLSASGKTTLAKNVVEYIKKKKRAVQLLDGDIMRKELGKLFGYSREDRIKTAQIYRAIASLLNQNGVISVVAAIAPYEEIRTLNRDLINNYYEVYINCSLEECIRRDPKGLYKKALAGKEQYVIGVDEPYEKPNYIDFEVDTEKENIDISTNKIIDFINKNNLINYKTLL